MSAAIVNVIITVEDEPALAAIRRYQNDLQTGVGRGIDKILNTIEGMQIHKYTSGASPASPPGSDYERTFTLRRSSRKERTGYIWPEISGVWYADPNVADYAEYVLGSTADQAHVHRGRWLSLEEVTEEIGQIGPNIINEEIAGIRF